jgi:hypothetical protein
MGHAVGRVMSCYTFNTNDPNDERQRNAPAVSFVGPLCLAKVTVPHLDSLRPRIMESGD